VADPESATAGSGMDLTQTIRTQRQKPSQQVRSATWITIHHLPRLKTKATGEMLRRDHMTVR